MKGREILGKSVPAAALKARAAAGENPLSFSVRFPDFPVETFTEVSA